MNAVLKLDDYRDSSLTSSLRNDIMISEDRFAMAEAMEKASKRDTSGWTSRGDKLLNTDRFAMAEEIEKSSKKVFPLSSEDEVNMVVMELAKGSMRDACLFVLGCNTQLRVDDLLTFRWRNIIDPTTGKVKDEFSILEGKNKNLKHVYVNDAIKLAVDLYRSTVSPIDYDDFMFVSHGPHVKIGTVVEGGCIVRRKIPVTEQFVGYAIRKATKSVGLWSERHRYNTHTMRKTGIRAAKGLLVGRKPPEELMQMGTQLEYVQGMVGHSDARVTAKYIDLQDLFDKKVYLWMNLGIEALREIEGDFKRKGL